MAEIKVYTKRGNTNYKEKKLIKALREKLAKKMEQDPTFKVEPATSFDELKELHDKYVAEAVPFEEVKETISPENTTQKEDMSEDNAEAEIEEAVIEKEEPVESSSDRDFVDPFNREEPIVRDYVLGEDDYGKKDEKGDEAQTFDEPKSEKEAFEIPDGTETEEESGGSEKEPKKEEKKAEKKADDKPINPAFDEMSPKKQKRSTKRFAKHIVNAVCTLLEKGFVWYANKDINEAKLAEYELSGEIDLSLILEMEGGAEATVKDFFIKQCKQAEELAGIAEDDKEDLIDALAEVLMEKGVAPSPMQELMMVGLNVVGGQAILLMGLKQQTNSVLTQLRALNEGTYNPDDYEQAAHEHEAAAHEHEAAAADYEKAAEAKGAKAEDEVIDEPQHESELLLSDSPVETKE